MKNISYRVALGGIVSALCLLCMFLAGIMPLFYLLLPMTAGVLLMIIAEEVSLSWAWLTYASVSLLSLFITADKESALIFIMLFGHYPILRIYLGRLKPRGLRNLIKATVFNLCAAGFFYVTTFIFGIDQMLDDMGDYGKYGAIVFLVLANVIFVLYDFNLGAAYVLYIKRLMPRLLRKRRQ
ncbi:MAG: hypothetical protein K2J37_02255 [Ruminococcus sp.]|nr:hypothetical protein [Ruminococcus sp.]